MSNKLRQLGNEGEDSAVSFLGRLGYEVVDRQVQTPFGELDILALDGNELVFVEVKFRHAIEGVYPEQSITQKKFRCMVNVAEFLLTKMGKEDFPWRLDVIAITAFPNAPQEVIHFKAVDEPCRF